MSSSQQPSSPPAPSNNASSMASDTNSRTLLKSKSNDVGWEFGSRCSATNMDMVKCNFCGKEVGGGITRLKYHIANIKGNVEGCKLCTPEARAKCKAALNESKKKKENKNIINEEIREEVEIQEMESIGIGGSSKRPRELGPMDKYASKINPDDKSMSENKKRRQQNINDSLFKERTLQVHQYLARWVYEAGIPFHALDNDSFKKCCEAIGQFGPGYYPPSQYLLREPLLKGEVERTKLSLTNQEEEWALNGCTIMTDAWSDRNRRNIMNLCVNCRLGTTFLSSKEASEDDHVGAFIFDYVDKCIEEVGPQNVVQVVTDNATNNMSAKNLLLDKRPNIFWSSCATHTINLMLESIGKLPIFKSTIEKAKAYTTFIYAHHKTLYLMRKKTKREIVRPGVTRFATSFLTLQSMMEKKEKLRQMVNSNEWEATKWSRSKKGKVAYATVVSPGFWNGIALCLNVFKPLVKVLRLVDGEKPSMGFVYGELEKAKEEIKEVYHQKEDKYALILEKIALKGDGRLDTPLHLTAYVLNPFYYYKSNSLDGGKLMDALITCAERFYLDDVDKQDQVVNVEFLKYKNKEGAFGKPLAAKALASFDSYDPVGWWSIYGNHTPNLQRMAKKILALTSSSSGCERGWSVFEGIHTKKRNRLDTKRMDQLVYVQFNARLQNKKARKKDRVDVLLESEASNAQSWIIEGVEDVEVDDEEVFNQEGLTWGMVAQASGANEELQARRSGRHVDIREPEEDDFVSDGTEDEVDDEDDFEFESEEEDAPNYEHEDMES